VALEAMGNADAESLAVHWRGAGDIARGGRYAEKAGDESASALAFDHAAGLFELALEGPQAEKTRALALREKLGEALANAGRGAQAAAAYRAAADHANAAHALDLRRRAADQLLRGGHFDEGLAAADDVLRSVGMRLPRSPMTALLSLLFWRAYLWFRGLSFKERDPSELTAAELTRADVCWSIAFGLSFSDHIRGAAFGARFLALALNLGEPRRVARALALQVGYVGAAGESARRATWRLIERAHEVVARTPDPNALGWVHASTGLAHVLLSDYSGALPHLEDARQIFSTRCTNVAWEIDTVQFMTLSAMTWAGQVDRLAALVPQRMHEARERGDRYATVYLRTGLVAVYSLLLDEPERLRQNTHEAMQEWPAGGFHVVHFNEFYGLLLADLYERKLEDAERRVRRAMPSLRRSLLLKVQTIRVTVQFNVAQMWLAIAEAYPARKRHALLQAIRLRRRLGRGASVEATIARLMLSAACASVSGSPREHVTAPLLEAIPLMERVGFHMYAAYAKRLLGLATGGDEGAAMYRAANEWLREQGVRNPDKLANCMIRGEARFREPPAAE
jgi:tetratricopeptide (TPR) repeat protein